MDLTRKHVIKWLIKCRGSDEMWHGSQERPALIDHQTSMIDWAQLPSFLWRPSQLSSKMRSRTNAWSGEPIKERSVAWDLENLIVCALISRTPGVPGQAPSIFHSFNTTSDCPRRLLLDGMLAWSNKVTRTEKSRTKIKQNRSGKSFRGHGARFWCCCCAQQVTMLQLQWT